MSYGLCNPTKTFQQLMHHVASGFEFWFAYIDNLLIATKSHFKHFYHLCQVFK